jgi:alcohol dehydrogenase class IV
METPMETAPGRGFELMRLMHALKPHISVERAFFGAGAIGALPGVLRDLGVAKALIVTDRGVAASGIAERVRILIEGAPVAAAVFDATDPEPGAEVPDGIAARYRNEQIGCVVGLGGGSCLDTAKAVGIMLAHGGTLREYLGPDKIYRPGLPVVLVPTTSGTGSEATPNALFIVDGEKQAVLSRHIMPTAAIIDPELTLTAPAPVTAASGLDALVHAVETYTSLGATAVTEMYSLRAVELIAGSIRSAVWRGSDLAARTDMALGSYLAGVAIANAGTGAVHALAYPLGGKYRVAHGMANALMFPYVTEWNIPSDMRKFATLARAIGEPIDGLSLHDAAFKFLSGIEAIIEDVGVPRSLDDVGIPRSELGALVEGAAKQTRLLKNNPRVLSKDDMATIYTKAWR